MTTSKADKKRLINNYLSLVLLQATNFILPLLTLPYLVRVLGTDKFGQVMFAQAFIVFFNVFVWLQVTNSVYNDIVLVNIN